jgi:chemotaxis signal transduction protein
MADLQQKTAFSSGSMPALDAGEFLESDLPVEESRPERQYCVFRAGRERFCLSVLEVEEVVDWPIVTRIPLAPAFLMGVFNLRGTIVPLMDIAFTEGRRPGLLPKHVVVAALQGEAQGDDVRLGIAADEVIGTFSAFEDALLDQAPNDVPHCRGMLRHEDRLALLVDLRRLTEIFRIPVI